MPFNFCLEGAANIAREGSAGRMHSEQGTSCSDNIELILPNHIDDSCYMNLYSAPHLFTNLPTHPAEFHVEKESPGRFRRPDRQSGPSTIDAVFDSSQLKFIQFLPDVPCSERTMARQILQGNNVIIIVTISNGETVMTELVPFFTRILEYEQKN